jgi:Host cell surface-exposed lipoprotein
MRTTAPVLAVVALVLALAGCSEAPVAATSADSCRGSGCTATMAPQYQYTPPPAAAPLTATAITPAAPLAPAAPAEPSQTVSQANAIESADNYLGYTAFSRSGLIKQLKFEKFSTADATYAVDHITVDGTEQADKSAKNYMDYSSFSRAGLIEQLKFEGFTQAQAQHGATSVGL